MGDLVIGLIRQLGKTVLPANVSVPPSANDFLGHGFEDIYVNATLPARAAVVSLLNVIAGRLPYPPSECPVAPGGDCGGEITLLRNGFVLAGGSQEFTFDAIAGAGVIVRVVDEDHGTFSPMFAVYGPTGQLETVGSGDDLASSGFAASSHRPSRTRRPPNVRASSLPPSAEWVMGASAKPWERAGGARSPVARSPVS